MARIQPGDILVMHDGNVYNPAEEQRHTVEATARIIPLCAPKGTPSESSARGASAVKRKATQ